MRKVTTQEWKQIAHNALGKDWEYKIGKAGNNKILGQLWVYTSPNTGSEHPLSKNFFFDPVKMETILPKSEEELKRRVEEFENIKPYGQDCSSDKEFIQQYLKDCLEMNRLPGIDSPFDWRPVRIDKRFESLFDKLHDINRNVSICVSGGIGNPFQRLAKVEKLAEEVLGHKGSDGFLFWDIPTKSEMEKIWVLLMIKKLKECCLI